MFEVPLKGIAKAAGDFDYRSFIKVGVSVLASMALMVSRTELAF